MSLSRSLSRTVIVTTVALTIAFAIVPAAQASPFELSRSHGNWFDLAWSWFSGLLDGPQEAASSQPKSAMEATKPIDSTGGVGGYSPLSGGCLDPEGRPKPCF
ncbi:MAG TPA: hypothetical protein VE078_05900 [Thermoanaerobaculia bacterium]|nr:hypothetical protein [Thermoanaerobaculia bacterium]